jgi:hypothetical protein
LGLRRSAKRKRRKKRESTLFFLHQSWSGERREEREGERERDDRTREEQIQRE